MLGSFGKGIKGAVTANFSRSGGANCDSGCSLKGNGCYAETLEKRKGSIARSGELREEIGFLATCQDLEKDLRTKLACGNSIPWFRFSAFGSLPNRLLTKEEQSAFLSLVNAIPKETPIHFPVEAAWKAAYYRELISRSNKPTTIVRLSFHGKGEPDGPFSIVFKEGKTRRERLGLAKEFARKISARVCPAIACTFLRVPKGKQIKCGAGCNACAEPGNVIYPLHG